MSIDLEQFSQIINGYEKENPAVILLQRSPDPDAMGSAAGMKLLLEKKFELDAKIYYFGEISHPQNKSMKNVLHISMEEGGDLDTEEIGPIIVVDADLIGTGFKKIKKIQQVDIRIDHHATDRNGAFYTDVRPVGACCSIVWDYLRTFGINIEENEEVATALVIGIETDTLHFTSGTTTDLDYEAYRHLLPHIDRAALAKVNRFTLPKIQFDKEKMALENLQINNSIATSFIGEINEHNRDIISTIADRFSRMETVSTVVIMGVIENHLVASVRSEDTRHDVHTLCTKAFGKDFSGAKEGSGGARVPLGVGFDLLEGEFKQEAIEKAIEGFRVKILEALGE